MYCVFGHIAGHLQGKFCLRKLQKSALLTVLQADLLQVHPVVCRLSPCPKYHFMMFQTIQTIHFWKALGPRISKLIFPSVSYTNTQTQIHKDTKTRIQHMTKCQKDPACAIFLKRGLFKDIKNYIPVCQTHKYKNTNTQIHKYSI